MNPELPLTILRNLLTNEPYMRRVIPFIKKEYFEGVYNSMFSQVCEFVEKYKKQPTLESLKIEIDDSKYFDNEEHYQTAMEMLPSLFDRETKTDNEWLIEKTEKWCQDRAIFLAIMESISVIDGKHKKYTKDALPDILREALGVTFDTNVGHDFLENASDRFDFYHEKEERIPFDLDFFNRITKGGLPNKTLNVSRRNGCW